MTKGDYEGRIATLEANMLNIGSVVLDIKNRQIDSGEKRNAQHIEIVKQLNTIEISQKAFATYQAKCDAERDKLGAAVTELKQTQQVHKRVAGIFGTLITGALGFVELFKH